LTRSINKFTPGETCQHARDNYAEGREVDVAGRITAQRDMGKSIFIDVCDQSGACNAYAQKQTLGDAPVSTSSTPLTSAISSAPRQDVRTKTNEPSISFESFVILAKGAPPPPANTTALKTLKSANRQRYLDLMANPEVKEVFSSAARSSPRSEFLCTCAVLWKWKRP